MTSEQWEEVKERFHEAIEQSAETQPAFLVPPCSSDIVRLEVARLLMEHSRAAGFLTQPVMAQTAPISGELGAGAQCGGYRLVKEIGHGGMGRVWLAEREDGLVKRPVALKLPHAGILATEFALRAHRERDILAGLSHPGIARLYDAGLEAGRPFLVLEFIDGTPLDKFCDQQRLTVRARLDLFLQILQAVQYAHSSLVIHSDLKPANILVAGDGQVKLLDFGIAKLISSEAANEGELTQIGSRAATPGYAAPEQLAGQRITIASDIYSLGVILYELLCGERPPTQDFDTPPPSRAVMDEGKAQARACSRKKLSATLKGDLDTIALKAIQPLPEKRYTTADAFRSDIERHLAGEPVLARPESYWYRTRKFIRRHRVAVSAAACVALALVAGLSAALWEAHVAKTEAQTSAAVQQFITDIFETNSRDQPDPVKARQTTARQLLDVGARKIDTGLNAAPAAKEKMLDILANLYYDLGLSDEAVALRHKQVAVAKALYGANDSRVAVVLSDLGADMHASRSVNEREAVLLQAKAILDNNRDLRSPARGRLLTALSEHYQSTDRQKALDFARQAIALYRQMPPSGNLAGALYHEGVVYGFSNQPAEAEAALAEAVSISQKVVGDRDPELPLYAAHLAQTQVSLLHYAAAQRNFELALSSARALNGDEHVDTIETEGRLGQFFSVTSQHPEALRHLKRALDICLKINGPDDPFYTPQILLMYGEALANSGHFEPAMAAISQAVENRRKNRPGTRYLAQMLGSQALVLTDLGAYEKARLCLDESAAISKKVGFEPPLTYGAARLQLAFDLSKPDEASSIIERFYGPLSDRAPLSLDLLRNLNARAQLALMKNDAAGALLWARRLADLVAASPDRKYLRLWEERAALKQGNAQLQMHHAAQALASLQHAVQLDEEIYDSGSAELLPAKVALAAAHLQMGNRAESAKLLAQAESIRKLHPHLGMRFLPSSR
jgi:serine/threonine-protein kinase